MEWRIIKNVILWFFMTGSITKCVKWIIIYSGSVDNLCPKIDADPISGLATDVSTGVHHLAR